MTEAEFQSQVVDLAHILKWRVAHFRPAQTAKGWRTPVSADGKGFPDLVLIRDRVIFAELKSERGRPSPEQVWWHRGLKSAGADAYIWKPSDFDEITAVLR